MTKVLVTGGNGFIGTHIVKLLEEKGYTVSAIGKDYCDLLGPMDNIESMLTHEKPDKIVHLAGVVGGIMKNKECPYDMLYQNLAMNTQFLEACRKTGQKRLLYAFCGCSFGKDAPNPIKEDQLFKGLPDENAMFYSLGKAVNHLQVVACRRQYGLDWSSVIPGNAFGPGDNFDEKDSHVIAGLIRRFYQAKETHEDSVTCWGDGSPVRDFIYIDDVAEGIVRALEKHHEELPINICSGTGVSIKEVTEIVKRVVGFQGDIKWDTTKPNGHNIKVFSRERQEKILQFEPKVRLEEGIKKTYEWYSSHQIEGFL